MMAAQAAAGLALALGFLSLGTQRTSGMALLCAAQALTVALGALVQGQAGVALIEAVEAATLTWFVGTAHPSLQIRAVRSHPPFPPYAVVIAGTVLAGLAAGVPGAGTALAVVLLGLLLVATRSLPAHQALGMAATQNGLVMTALAGSIAGWRLALIAMPALPALAFAGLWLGSHRALVARLVAPRLAGLIDTALCALALVLACALPWQIGAHGPFWQLDPLAAHAVLLVAALAAAAAWARRNSGSPGGSHLATLLGTVLAVLSAAPLLSWLGMALATVGAVAATLPRRAEAWRRLRLGCTGLALSLFGAIGLHTSAAPPTASACLMLGYGTLAMLSPAQAVATVALILRLRGHAAENPLAGGGGSPSDPLLLALGLAALLAAALAMLAASRDRGGDPTLAGLGQGGVAVFAFGLGSSAADIAGLLQLSFLALTQCAVLLSRPGGWDRLAALAGLGGVAPFGLFASLALVVVATAGRIPWLLLPLGSGLAGIAWAVLRQLPGERRWLLSPAWVPLALLLLAGFAMPGPLLAWFRLAAE